MKLIARGKNPYLEFAQVPQMKALLETETLFDATEKACEAMLRMVASDNPLLEKSSLELWIAMRDLHVRMADRMEGVEMMVELAEQKIRQEYHDVLEETGT